jgi:putative ABC transport system permease protein
MSVPVARRQLTARRGRTIAGVAGIAVALLLVLALKAIFAGMEQKITAYVDSTRADVVVSQRGITTMHMSQSALPSSTVASVEAVPGVAQTTPILYSMAQISRGGNDATVYLIGQPRGGLGPTIVAGRLPNQGEVVLDRVAADQLGVTVGQRVPVLGHSLRVSGLTSGTASFVNSVALLKPAELGRILQTHGVVSYIFVRATPGMDAETLASRIQASVPGVTAVTRAAFDASERRVVGDMSTDIVRGMVILAFVIGVAVAALVTYTSTLNQLRDYAVLRAIGLRARGALGLVIGQTAVMVIAGFLVALATTWLLSLSISSLMETVTLTIKTGDVVQAAVIAALVATAAAAVPIMRVLRLDPASVYRR